MTCSGSRLAAVGPRQQRDVGQLRDGPGVPEFPGCPTPQKLDARGAWLRWTADDHAERLVYQAVRTSAGDALAASAAPTPVCQSGQHGVGCGMAFERAQILHEHRLGAALVEALNNGFRLLSALSLTSVGKLLGMLAAGLPWLLRRRPWPAGVRKISVSESAQRARMARFGPVGDGCADRGIGRILPLRRAASAAAAWVIVQVDVCSNGQVVQRLSFAS